MYWKSKCPGAFSFVCDNNMNGAYYLLSTSNVSGPLPGARIYLYSWLAHEKMKEQRGVWLAQSLSGKEWWSQRRDRLGPEALFRTAVQINHAMQGEHCSEVTQCSVLYLLMWGNLFLSPRELPFRKVARDLVSMLGFSRGTKQEDYLFTGWSVYLFGGIGWGDYTDVYWCVGGWWVQVASLVCIE
jgi:hypothetical protein